ncbi:MAG TPA: hypothetical protein VH281_03355 [Gaiellaceae bacterium]
MPDLELALRELGAGLDWPAEPDLAPRVLADLGRRPRSRARFSPRTLVIALAVVAVAVGAVFAVPQTRAAILKFFHLRGVTIERVPELPTVPVQPGPGTFLGERVSMGEARARAGFEVVVPDALGEPDAVYFQESPPPGGMVSFLYGTQADPRALFTEFAASVDDVIFKKIAPDTTVEKVTVDGQPGFWIEGAHYFTYLDRHGVVESEQVRLAGNVLLWERGTRTLRLEADVSKAEALRIAGSVG